MQPIDGIHHITLITGDAPRNVDFYARVLGLRMVKKTVNQDDPGVYHLFYADEHGSPGADITFFEYPGAVPGTAGAGMVSAIQHRVAGDDALGYWEQRLGDEGVATERLADGGLRFADPEGMVHELVISSAPDAPLIAAHREVPAQFALQGFEAVRAKVQDPARSEALLQHVLGFTELRTRRLGGAGRHSRRPDRVRAVRRARHPRRRHRPPHRLGRARGRARRLASARGRLGRPSDAGDRSLLVRVGLLP